MMDYRRPNMRVEWPKDEPKAAEPLTELTGQEILAEIRKLAEAYAVTRQLILDTMRMPPQMVQQTYPPMIPPGLSWTSDSASGAPWLIAGTDKRWP